MRSILVALSFAFLVLACSDGGSEGAPCNPFDAQREPIALSGIIAIGRDQHNIIRLIDHPAGEEFRAFEQHDDRLVRYEVLGSSHGIVNDIEYYEVRVLREPAYALYVELVPLDPRFMYIPLDSPSERSMPGAVGEGEELEQLGIESVEDLTVVDLPLDITVEYLGNLEDGRRLLVARPSGDLRYEDFRVFIGTKDAMVEHPVQSVQRQRDGGSTTIELTLDGETATLSFAVEMLGTQFVAGPAMLTLADGTVVAVDLLDASPDAIGQHTFVCN